MTTPGSYGDHADPVHIWAVCSAAARAAGQHGDAMLAGRRFPVRVVMPGRPAAATAVTALRRAGYAADRVATPSRGRELFIHGWSADRLEARLNAMRAVIRALAADPGATAAGVLDQLGDVSEPPGPESRLELARQAERDLDTRITNACGYLATVDAHTWPPDHRCALGLNAVEDASEVITDLSVRHLQITDHALTAYSPLRAATGHADARDTALRQARAALPLGSRLAAAARLFPGQDSAPQPATGTPPADRPRSQRGAEPTQIFPAGTTSAAPPVPPPPAAGQPRRPSSPGRPRT